MVLIFLYFLYFNFSFIINTLFTCCLSSCMRQIYAAIRSTNIFNISNCSVYSTVGKIRWTEKKYNSLRENGTIHPLYIGKIVSLVKSETKTKYRLLRRRKIAFHPLRGYPGSWPSYFDPISMSFFPCFCQSVCVSN